MNTLEAEELLKAAKHDPGKAEGCPGRQCSLCDAAVEAESAISRLGFTPATLAVAIKLAEALGEQGWEWPKGEWHIPSCSRRSDWEFWLKQKRLGKVPEGAEMDDEGHCDCSPSCTNAREALAEWEALGT